MLGVPETGRRCPVRFFAAKAECLQVRFRMHDPTQLFSNAIRVAPRGARKKVSRMVLKAFASYQNKIGRSSATIFATSLWGSAPEVNDHQGGDVENSGLRVNCISTRVSTGSKYHCLVCSACLSCKTQQPWITSVFPSCLKRHILLSPNGSPSVPQPLLPWCNSPTTVKGTTTKGHSRPQNRGRPQAPASASAPSGS